MKNELTYVEKIMLRFVINEHITFLEDEGDEELIPKWERIIEKLQLPEDNED